MSKRYWTTQEGEEIEYAKLADDHLLNILKWIEKKAIDGFTIVRGGGFWDIDDIWTDEQDYSGDEAKAYFDFKGLAKEALRRGLITEKEYLLRI